MKRSLILFTSIFLFLSCCSSATRSSDTTMTFKQKVLKTIYPLLMKLGKSTAQIDTLKHPPAPVDFYSLHFTLNNDSAFLMSSCKGKKVLLVNTASNCGFTAQYDALEKLYLQYQDSLIIIAFPANDFNNQEKGDDATIANFCKKNYGITFPIAKKASVIKKKDQQLVFKWLTDKTQNGWNVQEPTWNFCKYLINENGQLTHFFSSSIDPLGPEVHQALFNQP